MFIKFLENYQSFNFDKYDSKLITLLITKEAHPFLSPVGAKKR